MPQRPICFVISPIGKEGTDIRARADTILKHVITPVVVPLGYEPLRSDKISESGMITNQVISHLLNDLGNDAQTAIPENNAKASIRHANRDDFVAVTPVNAEIRIQCEDLS